MTDVSKLIQSGPGSAGAAGFLEGVAKRGVEDRESRRGREKNALAAFITLTKEGWTPVDETKGTPSGEVISIEGFGSFVPPVLSGESEKDLATAFKLREEGKWYSRRPGETGKQPVFKPSKAPGSDKWTIHKWDDDLEDFVDTGRPAAPPSESTHGMVTWINRKDPKQPTKSLPLGVKPPGDDWVEYSDFTDLRTEQEKRRQLEAKELATEMREYRRAIVEQDVMIDLVRERDIPEKEQKALIQNYMDRKREYQDEIEKRKKRFLELVGGKALKTAPIKGRQGTNEEWAKIGAEAEARLGLTDKKELTIEDEDKLTALMRELAEKQGIKLP